MKVIHSKTGEQHIAIYGCNRLGNMRYWVNGKFYSDAQFDKLFYKLDPSEHFIKVDGKWIKRSEKFNYTKTKTQC